MPHRDWPIDKWKAWHEQPPHRWIKGPYFNNRHERKEQMCREYKLRGFKRRKVSMGTLIAQMRFKRGHQVFSYLKKKVMRRLGLRHKTINQYTTVDFVRVGAESESSFTININARAVEQ